MPEQEGPSPKELGIEGSIKKPAYTLADLAGAEQELKEWQERYGESGNNPNRFMAQIRQAASKVRTIENSLREAGLIELTTQEKLNQTLDLLYPNAQSKMIVAHEGQRYQIRYYPMSSSRSGKTVHTWGHDWQKFVEPQKVKREKLPREEIEQRRQEFLQRVQNISMSIRGDLENQDWQKTGERTGHDTRYNAFTGQHKENLKTYPEITYKKGDWEIEKTLYDKGHTIYDIKNNNTSQRQGRPWYGRWTARVEDVTKEGKTETGVYIRHGLVGLHFENGKFITASRYYEPEMSRHAGQWTMRSKNFRTFDWNPELLDKAFPSEI